VTVVQVYYCHLSTKIVKLSSLETMEPHLIEEVRCKCRVHLIVLCPILIEQESKGLTSNSSKIVVLANEFGLSLLDIKIAAESNS